MQSGFGCHRLVVFQRPTIEHSKGLENNDAGLVSALPKKKSTVQTRAGRLAVAKVF
jgi:hypothetical protein